MVFLTYEHAVLAAQAQMVYQRSGGFGHKWPAFPVVAALGEHIWPGQGHFHLEDATPRCLRGWTTNSIQVLMVFKSAPVIGPARDSGWRLSFKIQRRKDGS